MSHLRPTLVEDSFRPLWWGSPHSVASVGRRLGGGERLLMAVVGSSDPIQMRGWHTIIRAVWVLCRFGGMLESLDSVRERLAVAMAIFTLQHVVATSCFSIHLWRWRSRSRGPSFT